MMLFWLFTLFTLLLSIYLTIRLYIKQRIERIKKAFLKPLEVDWKVKDRRSIVEDLKNIEFDILVIGGGSSGAGCALDAATRGLKVALIESDDFGSGTSSKSTKLLHGGIRYLEKAFLNLDYSQFKLVSEALSERKVVMEACPYLTNTIDIMFPIYRKIKLIYYYVGLMIYDWMAGVHSLGRSKYINREDTIKNYKHVRKERLLGSIIYKDGQFNDAKYNIIVALTAAYYGATIINHCKLIKIVKVDGKIVGAIAYDKISQSNINIKAKVIINTTGPFADDIRALQNKVDNDIILQSSGTHIVVSKEFGPTNMGFVDPNTQDGRIAFLLPYKGKVLMGATDIKCDSKTYLSPNKDDLEFLMHEINFYTDRSINLSKKDVLSVWTGIRPLIKDQSETSTEKVVRKNCIKVDREGMITLSGGKWTIYRLMAEQTIDKAVSIFKLKTKRNCLTHGIKMVGSQGYSCNTKEELKKNLKVPSDIAEHLAKTYGTRALLLKKYIVSGHARLIEGYPYIKEEVLYQMEYEMAFTISDVLFNRLSISYIDVRTALAMVETVGNIMKEYYKWSDEHFENQCNECKLFLKTTFRSCYFKNSCKRLSLFV